LKLTSVGFANPRSAALLGRHELTHHEQTPETKPASARRSNVSVAKETRTCYIVSWSDRNRLAMPRQTASGRSAWKLEDAKARFSEVVRLARSEGPQRVTVRGKEAVVVISVEELEKLQPPEAPREDLVSFLRGLDLAELDLTRERDEGRDIVL
jgi:prevent-host-death family protein